MARNSRVQELEAHVKDLENRLLATQEETIFYLNKTLEYAKLVGGVTGYVKACKYIPATQGLVSIANLIKNFEEEEKDEG